MDGDDLAMMRRWTIVLVVAGAATAAWVGRTPEARRDERPSVAARTQPPAASQRAPAPFRWRAAPRSPVSDEPHVAPEAPAPRDEERPPSHPLTAKHRVIQHELDLLRRLDDAYDRQDHAAMRSLLDTYREHHDDDVHALQAGYAVLADCLDPSLADDASTLARAHAYYDEARASTLRRFVRRSCLER